MRGSRLRGATCLILAPGALAVAGCDPDAAQTDAAQADAPEAEDELGHYQITLNPTKFRTLGDELFVEPTVPCHGSNDDMVQALWALDKKMSNPTGNPELVDWGIREIPLLEAQGKLVALVYSVEPGDEEVTTTAVQHYIVNSECRILVADYVEQ